MKISIAEIGRAADLHVDPSLRDRPVAEVLRFYPGAPQSERILYIGTPEEVRNVPRPALFLSTEPGFGKLYVRETADTDTLLARCHAALMQLQRVRTAYRLLDDTLLAGHGYGAILEAGSELLANPLLLADKSFKVMAHAGCDKYNDAFLSEITRTGYYPEQYISDLAKNEGLSSMESEETLPAIVSESISPKRYLTTDLVYKGRFFGFITLVEEQPFLEGDREIFQHLKKVLVSELRNGSSRGVEGTVSETVLLELLNGQLHGGRLKSRMAQAGFDFSRGAHVIVIKNRADEPKRHRYEYLLNYVVSQLQNCPCAIFNDGIVGIMESCDTERGRIAGTALRDFLDYYGMVCGISNRIDRAEDLPVFFAQGVCAQQYGQQLHGEGPIYLYETYCFYQILDNLSASFRPERFCSPKYLTVLDYDRRNGTEYTATMNAYLEACRDLVKTAEALYLHRNTVSYRIRRINELFGIDLEDKDTFFSFLLTMRILQFIRMEKESGV